MARSGGTGVSLVGRDDELSIAATALDEGASGISIVGTRGVGRSTVLRVLAQRQAQRRVVHRLVTSRAASQHALSAIAPLLVATEPSTLPDLLRVSPAAVPPSGAGAPPLVVVDDAHLLDQRSAFVLRQLLAARRIAVALSVPRGCRITDAVAAMQHDDALVHLDVTPLERAHLEILLQRTAGCTLDRSTLDAAWAATHGHPLFALAFAAPAGVRRDEAIALAASRVLDGLQRSARRAAEVLAAGGVVPMHALASLGLERATNALLRSGLVQVGDDAPISRATDLVLSPRALALGLRHTLGDAGIRSACRSLLAVTASSGPTPVHARWRLDAGERAPASWWLSAVRSVEDNPDPFLRRRCAEAAVSVGAGPRGLLELARAMSSMGAGAEAEEILARLTGDLEGAPERMEALVARAWNLGFVLHRPEEAQQLLEDAESASTDPGEQAELVCLRASLALHARGPDEALLAARGMLDMATPPLTRLQIATTLAPALSVAGRWQQSAVIAGEFLEHAGAETTPLTRMRVAAVHYWARLQSGHIDASLEASDRAAVVAEYGGNVGEAAIWRLGHGYAAMLAGRLATAASSLTWAESALRQVDLFGYLPVCLATRGRALALLGDVASAATALDEADRLVASSHPFTALDTGPDRAWLRACEGDLRGAGELAASSASRAIASGHTGVAVRLLWDVAIFGRTADAVAFADVADAQVEGALADTILDGVRALDRGDPEMLVDVAARFEEMGACLLAHTAAAHASHALRSAGRMSQAERMAAHAAALLSRCEGARSPLPLLLGNSRLTPREQQVAMLAGSNVSNHELAEHLGVSVRTVETHLHRVYMKLGVSGRAELASMWRDRLRSAGDART